MPIVETAFLIKGASALVHWIAAHGSTATMAKAGTLTVKAATTQGFAQTAAQVTAVAGVATIGAGCVVWTSEAVKILIDFISAANSKNHIQAGIKLGELAFKLKIVDLDQLTEHVGKFLLLKAGVSKEETTRILSDMFRYKEYMEASEEFKKAKRRFS